MNALHEPNDGEEIEKVDQTAIDEMVEKLIGKS